MKTKQKTNNFHLSKWERLCEGDDLTMVGCNKARRSSDLSLFCSITVLYRYCCCCSCLVTSDKLDAVFGYRVCDMAVYRKSAKLRRCNCSSVSHSLSSFVWKQAGYTATLVACGWAGAVLEKVTRASGQELYAQKAQQVAQGRYVVSDTRCPALHHCELE